MGQAAPRRAGRPAGPGGRADPDAARTAPGRRLLRIGLGLAAAALLTNAIIGDRGLTATRAARRDAARLAAEIAALHAENARLAHEAHRLRTDPAAIETVARQELGLKRADDVVFLVQDGPAPDPDAPPPPTGAAHRR